LEFISDGRLLSLPANTDKDRVIQIYNNAIALRCHSFGFMQTGS
jgi:hypothetical protein